MGTISVDFDGTVQRLIIYSAFIKYFRKNEDKMKQLLLDDKKVYDSARREDLYSILIEFCIREFG